MEKKLRVTRMNGMPVALYKYKMKERKCNEFTDRLIKEVDYFNKQTEQGTVTLDDIANVLRMKWQSEVWKTKLRLEMLWLKTLNVVGLLK